MTIYMKIEGVQGGVSAKAHENWIELDSMFFSVHQPVANKVGRSGDRVTGSPSLGFIEITKQTDPSSIYLLTNLLSKRSFDKVEVHFCSTQNTLDPYIFYEFSNVLIGDYFEGASSLYHMPREVMTLHFAQLKKSVSVRTASNQSTSPMR
ncbi:MAG: hypothetical protein A3F17_06140, partial [Gammaproteobacteria bacterium RIFCSPHIGHO2_12_FULL_41_15]